MRTKKTQTERQTKGFILPAPTGRRFRLVLLGLVVILAAIVVISPYTFAQGPRVVEITADKTNTFKVAGQKQPVITAKAKEVLRLRVTTRKGNEWDADGTAHSITIKELKDQGWDLKMKEGTKDFTVIAPSKAGEYKIECTVKCGKGHDDMAMKLVVTE